MEIGPGRGSSYIPKLFRYPPNKGNDYFSHILLQRSDLWKANFGIFTPDFIVELTKRLPFMSARSHKINNLNKVALFIHYMISPDSFSAVAGLWDISNALAWRYFYEILAKLIYTFKDVIRWPNAVEKADIQNMISNRGAPMCDKICIIDGIQIRCYINEGWNRTSQLILFDALYIHVSVHIIHSNIYQY